jgi:hypothetical protein
MLRRPKPTDTQSKYRSGKGSRSASHCTAGASSPLSRIRSRPRLSMLRFTSLSHTSPPGMTRRANARARSPLPLATSSTRSPERGRAMPTANAFHARCMPSDIKSFIRS